MTSWARFVAFKWSSSWTATCRAVLFGIGESLAPTVGDLAAPYDPAHPLATPRLGDTEIWRFVSDVHHPINLHQDTVDVRASESAEVAVRFTDIPGRYVFHCHNLEHEDMAMMADFVTN